MAKKKLKQRLNQHLDRIDWKLMITCMFISFFVAYVGSSFTVIDNWYESIKPSITPPNFVFPIVWTILFFLIGLAFYYSWSSFEKDLGENRKGKDWSSCKNEERNKMGFLFSLNFAFNLAWSFFFFTVHSSISALFVIFLLALSIIALIIVNWKKARIASYLLIPYLIWICFATLLNILIVINVMK